MYCGALSQCRLFTFVGEGQTSTPESMVGFKSPSALSESDSDALSYDNPPSIKDILLSSSWTSPRNWGSLTSPGTPYAASLGTPYAASLGTPQSVESITKPASVSSAPEVTLHANRDEELGLDLSLPPKKSFASRRHSGDAGYRANKALHSPKYVSGQYDVRSPQKNTSHKRKRDVSSKSMASPAASVTSPASIGERMSQFDMHSSPGSPALHAKNAKLMTSPISSPASAPIKRDTSSPPPAATSQTKHLARMSSVDDVTNCNRPQAPPSSRTHSYNNNETNTRSPLSPNNNSASSPLTSSGRYPNYFASASVNSPVFPERPNDDVIIANYSRNAQLQRSTSRPPTSRPTGAHAQTPSPMQSGESHGGRQHGVGSNPNSNSSSTGACGDELTIEDVSGVNEGDEVAKMLCANDIKQEPQDGGSNEDGGSSGSRKPSELIDGRFCQVCGDNAAGFHCGAYVCEACKVKFPPPYPTLFLLFIPALP